jgi:hypothetical protein
MSIYSIKLFLISVDWMHTSKSSSRKNFFNKELSDKTVDLQGTQAQPALKTCGESMEQFGTAY